MSEKDYDGWLTRLNQLEVDLTKAFPLNIEQWDRHLRGKIPPRIARRLQREISSIRATLRNLRKLEEEEEDA